MPRLRRAAVKAAEEAKPKQIQHWTIDRVESAQDHTPSPSERLMQQRATEPEKLSASNTDRGWEPDFFRGIQRKAIIARLTSDNYSEQSQRDADAELLKQYV
jgi:hypothetical protein